jgi:hypothetical protein
MISFFLKKNSYLPIFASYGSCSYKHSSAKFKQNNLTFPFEIIAWPQKTAKMVSFGNIWSVFHLTTYEKRKTDQNYNNKKTNKTLHNTTFFTSPKMYPPARHYNTWCSKICQKYSHLWKVFGNVKKSLYNQPKPYFFTTLLWSHFWINFNIFYTKTFRIVYILFVYLLIMFIWVVFICT